ncbi:hypothetical protein MAL08_08665 [Leptospira noguchii]|uniref:hypothetical protein n=1 Tax=Leptospira noguchii TaxID=28182 RepID=UPI0002BEE251|nr:hypothetical protein [Leptospira noguchii]EMI72296.1 hypothetical protein LEP1GSC072_3356 [Leptospira noguchii str. Bonito]EMS89882.1 hypothetical protein LEP1GSC073_2867 [Leptospira noguchii str. Cascata]UOG39314.1 hypothetical protein MAL08_08665 [Leptospira noguchii]
MGKLTVRCPRCYESFLFDPEITRLQGFEKNSKEYNPYLKSSIRLFWENLKQTLLNFKSKFKNSHLLYQTPGKKLARNFLLLLLAIGIVRTCFFSPFEDLQNSNPFPDPLPETQPQEIQPEEQQPIPKFEI